MDEYITFISVCLPKQSAAFRIFTGYFSFFTSDVFEYWHNLNMIFGFSFEHLEKWLKPENVELCLRLLVDEITNLASYHWITTIKKYPVGMTKPEKIIYSHEYLPKIRLLIKNYESVLEPSKLRLVLCQHLCFLVHKDLGIDLDRAICKTEDVQKMSEIFGFDMEISEETECITNMIEAIQSLNMLVGN